MKKPQRDEQPGTTFCPQNGKDVTEVCHTCDWYRPVPMGRTDQHGKVIDVHDQWGCTVTHLLQVFRDWGAKLDGVQTATESRGNAVAARLDVIAEDMMAVSEVSKEAARRGGAHLPELTTAIQKRVGGARRNMMIEDKS